MYLTAMNEAGVSVIINLSNVDSIELYGKNIIFYHTSIKRVAAFESNEEANEVHQKIIEFLKERSCVL